MHNNPNTQSHLLSLYISFSPLYIYMRVYIYMFLLYNNTKSNDHSFNIISLKETFNFFFLLKFLYFFLVSLIYECMYGNDLID